MEKRTYYIGMEGGTILEDPQASPYQFVIEANNQEYEELQHLFYKMYKADLGSAVRINIPFGEYHNDPENHAVDGFLHEIYNKIYTLGNQETREFFENNQVLDSFQ